MKNCNYFIKAAVLESLGLPLKIRNLKLPNLQRGQVLVKVLFSGVCRSQLMEVSGARGKDRWLPHLLGHEGSGIVMEIGQDVSKFRVGDEVILGWIKSEGIEAPGARYTYNDTIINSGPVTTFSNYTIVSENRLVKKPSKLPFDEAVLYGCALATGAGMVLNEINLLPSNTVAVLGLGGIGLSALITLKALGIEKIIAIDISDSKLDYAKKLGANYVFNPSKENIIDSVMSVTDRGVDYCIESGGSVSTIELGFKIINKYGTLVFASHPPDGDQIKLLPHELISGKKIFGSWGGRCKPDTDTLKLHSLLDKAGFSLDKLITKRYRLEEINEAINDLKFGSVLRPLIVMDH